MLSSDYTMLHALGGGVLIGLATLLGSATTGVPPGISGVVSELLKGQKGEIAWRLVFLVGLVVGAMLAFAFLGFSTAYRPPASVAAMAAAGLLVGVGTRISGGCTSGHGVCGIGLGSRPGIAATCVFMAAGIATVYVLRHLVGAP